MSALQARVLPFEAAAKDRDPSRFNMQGLPRISDEEHMRRAMLTDAPISYIAARAGRMVYDGEDGMGSINAEGVMICILTSEGYAPSFDDVNSAYRQNGVVRGAIAHVQRFYPEIHARLAPALPDMRLDKPDMRLQHG